MARLIDADDLIERIEDVLSRREHRQVAVPSWLQKIIDELPTHIPPMTAEEAWELSKKLFAEFKNTELDEIFGKDWNYPKLMELSPYEAKAKIEEWGNKQIRVGDVVIIKNKNERGVVTNVNRNDGIYVLCNEGGWKYMNKYDVKKTGKHIDIQSVLDQIGGDESEV